MKRTALIAIMIAALAFGAVGFAVGNPEDVVVTATVNPLITLTVTGDVALGEVNPGGTYSGSTTAQVFSNKTWTLTPTVNDHGTPAFADRLTDTVTRTGPGAGDIGDRGRNDLTIAFELDLTDDDAWVVLDPETPYTATYTYTAVQN